MADSRLLEKAGFEGCKGACLSAASGGQLGGQIEVVGDNATKVLVLPLDANLKVGAETNGR
eukprot:8247141-Prorocentrum_lima.AAC.1